MADIVLTDLTNGSIQTVDGEYEWQGTGVFDTLVQAVNGNIKVQYDNGRIKDDDYATVYLGSMQSVIAQSMQYLLQEKMVEAQIENTEADTALRNELRPVQVADANRDVLLKEKQIESESARKADVEAGTATKNQMRPIQIADANRGVLLKEKQIEAAEKQLSERDEKFPKELEQMDIQKATLDRNVRKIEAEIGLTEQQKATMENQEADNRRIKVLNALGDTYGTAMAGGVTVDANAWKYYFSLAVNTANGLTTNANITTTPDVSSPAQPVLVS